MGRTPFDLADIVRQHRPALEAKDTLNAAQGRAFSAITLCRTAGLGGHALVCLECDHKEESYNSCRNRNCPKCQGLAQERWIAARAKAILPIPHFHGVFTLPAAFRPLARKYPREIYNAMFQSAGAAVLEMGQSRLGVTLGLTMVLHTWTRKLTFHPHVHLLISGGGLALDQSGFKQVQENFLLHVKPLAALFKGKMMAALRELRDAGVIKMTDGAFGTLMASLAGLDWNVYLKEAFRSAAFVLEYLGRYTHRIGISNSRLVKVTSDSITFRTKGKATETLKPVEFLRRFIQHVLPDRFKKIRHVGLYASPKALAQAKHHLGSLPVPEPPKPTWEKELQDLTGRDVTMCKDCGAPLYTRTIPMPGSFKKGRAKPDPKDFRCANPIPRSLP